jgi:hypothetical protein
MSETVNIFGKSYGVFEMSHKDKAVAWIQNSPYVDITVGRFTLRFKLTSDRDWGWVWEYMSWLVPDDFRGSPEEDYFFELFDDSNASTHDMDFIDVLLKEMQEKPFKGE